MDERLPVVLTIAGSDSGAGAGLQADLKTFAALGLYGVSVVTVVTAQNTRTVRSFMVLPPSCVQEQIEAVSEDFRIAAIKIGVLGSEALVRVVSEFLDTVSVPVVLDPVLVSQTGHPLVEKDAMLALREELLPKATVMTPNLPEVAALLETKWEESEAYLVKGAATMIALGAKAVLVKGGHMPGEQIVDVLQKGEKVTFFRNKRVATDNTHGTGCTLSSAIAAFLAQGDELSLAVAKAREYLISALRAGQDMRLGQGQGPVHHFHAMWPS